MNETKIFSFSVRLTKFSILLKIFIAFHLYWIV